MHNREYILEKDLATLTNNKNYIVLNKEIIYCNS